MPECRVFPIWTVHRCSAPAAGVTERTGTGLTQADFKQRPENERSSKTFQHLWHITRVFPFGPPAARMPWFPRLDRPSVLVLAASWAVLRLTFGPSIRARRGGLFGRLAAIVGPLGSLWGRPKAPMSLSEALLEAPQAYEELTRSRGAYAI